MPPPSHRPAGPCGTTVSSTTRVDASRDRNWAVRHRPVSEPVGACLIEATGTALVTPLEVQEMSEFVFVYRMPTNYTVGDENAGRAWARWFGDIGSDLVDRGKPAVDPQLVGECGQGLRLGGFSVVHADDLAAAVELARRCPALAAGGGVEVATLVNPTGQLS